MASKIIGIPMVAKFFKTLFFIALTPLWFVSSNIYAEISIQEEKIQVEQENSHKHSKKKKSRKHRAHTPKRSLEDQLHKSKNNSEVKHIKKLFTKLDELYASVKIKVQKIGDKDALGPEAITDLYAFLSGPSDTNEVVSILEHDLKRTLTQQEHGHISGLSLVEAIRALYREKIVDEMKAHAMILANARMTWDEILKLVDLGAVRTHTGYLIQAKTGDKYGNPIQLFEDFHHLAEEIIKSHGNSLSSVEDLLVHPVPDSIASTLNNFGPTASDTLSDARVISEIRRHFVFLSSIKLPISFRPGTTDFRPNALMSSGAPVNLIDSNGVVWALLRNLNAVYSNNHYFLNNNASLTNSVMLAPFALTYWGNYNWTAGGIGWWLSYTDKYLGLGGTYTVNFANGTFWSHGAPTYLMIGGVLAGWRNYLSAGISLMTMASSTVGVGASVMGTIMRDHDVNYKGLYPLDGRYPEIRGFHKIEIDDRKGASGQIAVAANFSNLHVPVMVAFRAGPEFTVHRVYRTHVELKDAQRMLTESEIPGVLFLLGKRIKETKLPSFMEPEKFRVGDEFVETKTGKLSGAFVVGLQSQIPIGAVRFGATLDLTAEFELGLRKLPTNKYEVSIEPKRIYEIGIFSSILNTIGAGLIESMSILKKQSFIFDFNNPEAVTAYFDLIDHGRLPSIHEIQIHSEERGPEYLLSEFRNQNEDLKHRGIALNYMEQVRVSSEKLHAGLNARMLSGIADLVNFADRKLRPAKDRINLRFDGIDWEFMEADAMSVATNGIVAVRRSTSAYRKSVGQGTSGRFNKDIYITHRRVHTIDDSSVSFTANKWQFDSLLVAAQYEDNFITGNQENDMAKEIDTLFTTSIGSFHETNSRQPRMVHLERELSIVHLQQLQEKAAEERIEIASQISGVSMHSILSLLKRMKGKHPDNQALMVKSFIETQAGLSGFSAIHQLLGAQPEDIHIRTESGYSAVVNEAKKFIAVRTDHVDSNNKPVAKLNPYRKFKNKRADKKFYNGVRNNLRHIDYQLRLLNDDKYLIDLNDKDNHLVSIYGEERVRKLLTNGARQGKQDIKSSLSSTRKTLKELMDLEAQGVYEADRKAIYKMVGRRHLDLQSLVDNLWLTYKDTPLSVSLSRRHIHKRFKKAVDYLEKINQRIIRLGQDEEMINMDKAYVDEQTTHYKNMKDKIFSLLSFKGMNEGQVMAIRRKAGKSLMGRYEEIVLYNRIDVTVADRENTHPILLNAEDIYEHHLRDEHYEIDDYNFNDSGKDIVINLHK